MNFQSSTLVELLRWRASHQADQRAFTFLLDGENQEVHLSYGELDRQARAIGVSLQKIKAKGERALLVYPPGLEYISAFFGCLYAGVIAVPVYPPDPARLDRTLPRLQAIAKDAQVKQVLTTQPIMSVAKMIFEQVKDLRSLQWIATDSVETSVATNWKDPAVSEEALAFLQYTSGSTGSPKGVMLSHGNLLYNLALIQHSFEVTPQSVGLSWLPPYHDLGLIGVILGSLYAGNLSVLMSPLDFLKQPFRWLQAITRFRTTISGGPNFAYDLCVRRITQDQKRGLDLSSWDLAFNGAEPIRAETLEQFTKAFESCGFRQRSFYPCYGLAEATLIVSGGKKSNPPSLIAVEEGIFKKNESLLATIDQKNKKIVGAGRQLLGETILIVDPESFTPCPPGHVGEIWVSGPSVAQGYWNQPKESEKIFNAYLRDTKEGPFLRTGDLGFLKEGELFVTGRLKDLIIIAGMNHYPQDIELTVERSFPSLRRGCCAAFSVPIDGEERLVVAAEVERRYHERRRSNNKPPEGAEQRRGPDRRQLPVDPSGDPETRGPLEVEAAKEDIRQAVAEGHDLRVHRVVLLKAGTIPKTSSGKIMRYACRQAFLDGGLDVIQS